MSKLFFSTKDGSIKNKLLQLLAVTLVMSMIVFCPVEVFASYNQGYDINNGMFWFVWTNDKGNVNFNPTASYNGYSVNWTSGQQGFNFTCGKGWDSGDEYRKVHYEGSFNPGNNGYLALYGWAELPAGSTYKVAEYYVVESYGNWTPPGTGAEYMGTLTSDGATYNIYRTTRINQPWIVDSGTGSFYQYWSIRQKKVQPGNNVSGNITFKNHVEAWKKAGMTIGDVSKYYQVMETEGYESNGNSSINVYGIVNTPYVETIKINLWCGDSQADVFYVNNNKVLTSAKYNYPTGNQAIFEMQVLDYDFVNWNGWKRFVPVVALKSKQTNQYVTVANSTDPVKANSSSISNAQKFYYQNNYGYVDFRSLYNNLSLDTSGKAANNNYSNFGIQYIY